MSTIGPRGGGGMPFTLRCVTEYAGALTLVLPLAAFPQTRSVSGVVTTLNGAPVAHAEIRVEGANSTSTTGAGEFSLSLPQQYQTGFPLTLFVKGYVVVDPCSWGRGRTHLSESDTKVSLKVAARGDANLLAGNQLARLVELKTTQFAPETREVAAGFLTRQAS